MPLSETPQCRAGRTQHLFVSVIPSPVKTFSPTCTRIERSFVNSHASGKDVYARKPSSASSPYHSVARVAVVLWWEIFRQPGQRIRLGGPKFQALIAEMISSNLPTAASGP
jgi:hypothetical protein